MQRRYNLFWFPALLVSGYFIWRNRYRIQQFLESQGISTPVSTESATDMARSAAAKASGATERTMDEIKQQSQEAV